MRKFIPIEVSDSSFFKQKVVHYCKRVKYAAIYDSCGYYFNPDSQKNYHSYEYLAGLDCISLINGGLDELQKHKNKVADWLLGYFSYDLKNEIEKLYSVNSDNLNFPILLFFQPRYIIRCKNSKWEIGYMDTIDGIESVKFIYQSITDYVVAAEEVGCELKFEARVKKEKYIQTLESILEHIHRGDIYELNYCQEYFAKDAYIDPFHTYNKLVHISPTPFASFMKIENRYVISASPERYLKKVGKKLISQPIKGTASRGGSDGEDRFFKRQLSESIKEQSENIMIADLVRNDLSRIAARGSVRVEELCGIYPFRQVYQMITTIVAELEDGRSAIDSIKSTFPMGSMTGAPKIRAMKLIEKYEETKRGVYSGAVGYFQPNGDFDFNVVIRSLLYNSVNKYLSFMVGSAITEKSIPEEEFNECLLKASAIFNLFNQDIQNFNV